jgi:hypothetical protein
MNPTGQPNFGSAPAGPGGGGGGPVDAAGLKELVNVPSLVLLIGAIGGILMNLVGMAQNLMGANGMQNLPPEMMNKPEMQQFVTFMEGLQKVGPLFSLVGIAVCAFVAFGALKMRNLQSYNLAMAACIVGIIPCCYSCCCIFTMTGGIWGLVMLMKPEVKGAFVG